MKYQIKDLRGVIRVGDEIKFRKVSIIEERKEKIIAISDTDFMTEDNGKELYFYPFSSKIEVELIQNPITWETLREGDEIIFLYVQYVILIVSDEMVFLSDTDSLGWWARTKKFLKESDATIIQPKNITNHEEEVLEMTVKDVEKLVGKKVKIVKEK